MSYFTWRKRGVNSNVLDIGSMLSLRAYEALDGSWTVLVLDAGRNQLWLCRDLASEESAKRSALQWARDYLDDLQHILKKM